MDVVYIDWITLVHDGVNAYGETRDYTYGYERRMVNTSSGASL